MFEQPDRDFKITVLKKLSRVQENTEKQFTEIRKILSGQKRKYNRETEIISKKSNRNPSAEKYNEKNEKYNVEYQQQNYQAKGRICELETSYLKIYSHRRKKKKNEKK